MDNERFPGLPGSSADPREGVGRLVRQVWVEWAAKQPDPKPSWLIPWEGLDEGQKEVDMRIGAALFTAGQLAESARQPGGRFTGDRP